MAKVPVAEFTAGLAEEQAALKAFISLLEAEQQALINGNTEKLLALSENKTQAVQELNKLAHARKDNLLAHGVQIGEGGVMSWLRTQAPGGLPIWQNILQLVEQLQYLNNINGTLIQSKLRNNQQALTALHNAANSAHGLYGADGQPRLPTSGRILGSV